MLNYCPSCSQILLGNGLTFEEAKKPYATIYNTCDALTTCRWLKDLMEQTRGTKVCQDCLRNLQSEASKWAEIA